MLADIRNAIPYGALFDTASGTSPGYGLNAFMPLTCDMALTWLASGMVKPVPGGIAPGLIKKAGRLPVIGNR